MNQLAALTSEAPGLQKIRPASPPLPAATDRGGDTYLDAILRAARDPSVNIDKMERLMQMHERMQSLAAEKEFNSAMRSAQASLPRVARNKKGDAGKYADLEAIDVASRPIITESGFAESYGTAESPLPNHYRVTCLLSHVGGYSRPYHADVPTDMLGPKGTAVKTAIHGFGSAMSYGRRYLKCLIFNIVLTNEDDDGRAAGAGNQDLISDEQVEKLRQALDFVSGDEKRFCALLKVEGLADIRAVKFQAALDKINEKGRRQ